MNQPPPHRRPQQYPPQRPAPPQPYSHYYNYGLNEQSYRQCMQTDAAKEWDKTVERISRDIPKAEEPEIPRTFIPSVSLAEGGQATPQETFHWMKPMQFVLPSTSERIVEFPYFDPGNCEVAYLKDGYLNWQEHYGKKYAHVMEKQSSGQAETGPAKASGFRSLKKGGK
uniref:Uncharacterized protein n=2 Tax=Paramoeba aestuarina TaxID=180227 RepID=A0A7S4PIJ9_9EUKA